MKTPRMLMIAAALALSAASVDAQAQTIKRYDDAGDGSQSQIYIPGMPVPQPARPASGGEGGGETQEEAGEEGAGEGSYQISLYGTRSDAMRRAETAQLANRPIGELYRGVIPGTRDELPHLSDARREGARADRPNQLTWVGFQPEASRTRVFFQSPRPMRYRVNRGVGESPSLVLVFEHAEISTRNFSRFIDASYFGRAVTRIDAREVGGDVEVTILLREQVEPQVNAQGEYLYVDFPHQGSESDLSSVK
ncbi:hypothetical protein FRC91_04970 [Bradymonadales bacterium TMQ1]|nr:hypothetical protein FRC91_04970 [Bradymonadales bacterium TMQ1]